MKPDEEMTRHDLFEMIAELKTNRERMVPAEAVKVVNVSELLRQREGGWLDFHPEDFCHECGSRNPAWYSPEFYLVHPKWGGITCPNCFIHAADKELGMDNATWVVTPFERHDKPQRDVLADQLRAVTNLGDDADRVASCLLDDGYRRVIPAVRDSPSA